MISGTAFVQFKTQKEAEKFRSAAEDNDVGVKSVVLFFCHRSFLNAEKIHDLSREKSIFLY